jgi:hypothetical protein
MWTQFAPIFCAMALGRFRARLLLLWTILAASVSTVIILLPSHARRTGARASLPGSRESRFEQTQGVCKNCRRATTLRLRGGSARTDAPQFRLFKAVENGDVDGIEEAIHCGADVGAANPLGFMAIHIARCPTPE